MAYIKEKSAKKIDMVFVLALITLFAATALTLVLIGAKQYRHVTDVMDRNFEHRTSASYLTEKIRQNDKQDAIGLTTLEGTTALYILNQNETSPFTTYIYYYDGYLRELVVTESSVFTLSGGQPIMEIQNLELEIKNDSLIHAKITSMDGQTQSLYFNLHCRVGKEAL